MCQACHDRATQIQTLPVSHGAKDFPSVISSHDSKPAKAAVASVLHTKKAAQRR